jgi:hypothetical protein
VGSIEGVLLDYGISGKASDEIIVTLLTDLLESIWDNNSDVRSRFKTLKDFVTEANQEIKRRAKVKTRYQRDPVI